MSAPHTPCGHILEFIAPHHLPCSEPSFAAGAPAGSPASVAIAPGALVFLCSGPATLPPSFPGACPPPKEEYWLVQAVGVVSGGGVCCSTSYWSSKCMER